MIFFESVARLFPANIVDNTEFSELTITDCRPCGKRPNANFPHRWCNISSPFGNRSNWKLFGQNVYTKVANKKKLVDKKDNSQMYH